jgi:flagellar FliJ protein
VARFRFRLESVLEHRRMLEEARQREVAALERERLAVERGIREIQRRIERERDGLRACLAPRGPADARPMRMISAAVGHLRGLAAREVLRLAGVRTRLERARAALLEAATRRKAVELLRERRYEQWRSEVARREAAALDELAVMRAGRDGATGGRQGDRGHEP